MLKKLALFGAIALTAFATTLAPASARTLDEVISSGTIRVGVNPTLPPLGKFDEKNQIVGFDVDFATEIAKMLGVKLEVVQVGSPDRIPFVVSGKIDFVMGAMTRNPERAKVIDFTVPAHTEVLGILTTEGQEYKEWKEMDKPEVTFVQVRGSTPVKFIEENLKNAKVTLLDNYPDAVRALAQGRGTAMIDVMDFMGEHMEKHRNTKWKIVETPVDVYYCGLGVAKNSTGLKDWLNVAVFEMHRRGKTAEMWKKWFGMDMIEPVQVSPYF
ncbi:transporter substrate-binding domain-containing protein [Terrihabitans rhizophilus]|jgi:polar amino acid transport system substrate-binding protein|uniref:Transporter substrate-binding domain-containing protein n=1 Tax=Terrihabitans rhizophilus TaxID=3092662 RepID=A0ABU4RM87_9HYPH|nr:transporter substrate-binding domain-containing protein [Terrihabitans sp. PJ23]MDX6805942.1 transporter substrate-binding domain-containing protein [Terrihabitans sp. PJ23]